MIYESIREWLKEWLKTGTVQVREEDRFGHILKWIDITISGEKRILITIDGDVLVVYFPDKTHAEAAKNPRLLNPNRKMHKERYSLQDPESLNSIRESITKFGDTDEIS